MNMPHSLEEYINLATKSIDEFTKLYFINHSYKEKEEEIFKTLYEDEYRFNYMNPIEYSRTSSKVLLNVLKRHKTDINIYYIKWFDNEAFNDDVIDFIDKNNLIDYIFIANSLYEIPDLCVLYIKKHREYIFELSSNFINDKIISCIKEIGFKSCEIDEYVNRKGYIPKVLSNHEFILYLLEEDVNNIKYFIGKSLSKEILNYLFKSKNNDYMNFLLEKNIEFDNECINLLIEKIKEIGYNCLNIKNEYLLKNEYFLSQVISYLNIDNPYNLNNRYLVSNLGRTLEKLSSIFTLNDIEIIKREIIENDYDIDMLGIINNIGLNKLKEIYDKLYKNEIKFNDNFSFCYFIKIMDYFANHLSLVKELNENNIDDEIINNLALVINCNDTVNYQELNDYQYVYKNRISLTNLNIEDRIYRLLINSNRGKSVVPGKDIIDSFKEDILDIPQLTYLQLGFDSNSIEYKLLESYIELAKLLHNIQELDEYELQQKYFELMKNFKPKALFDANVIRENILRLYARDYYKNNLNFDELQKKGKYKRINDCDIYDITGEEFNLFVHSEEFHPVDDDFTSYDLSDIIKKERNNYLCCEFQSDLNYSKLTSLRLDAYSFKNPTSLIAFGNRDIYIRHTKKPFIEARDKFINPYDMAMFQCKSQANTEFDFLRFDDLNNKLESEFRIVENMQEALVYMKYNSKKTILIFDEQKHQEYLIVEAKELIENIDKLNYKQLYRLIALLSKFRNLENYLDEIENRINEFSEKEQLVLNDALNRYSIYTDVKRKVKK